MNIRLPFLFAVLLGLTALYSAALLGALLSGADFPGLDVVYLAVVGLCAASAWYAFTKARGTGRHLLAWAALSLSALALGEAAWVLLFDLPGLDVPDLSVADAGYLLYYLGLLGVLLTGQGRWERAPNPAAVLDTLITGLVVAEVSWVLAVVPLLQDGGASVAFQAINLFYVALDLVLLTLVLLTLRQPFSAAPLPLLLGLLAYVVADLLYFTLGRLYEPRGVTDLLWAWGTVGQALGVTLLAQQGQAAAGQSRQRLDKVLRALPYGAVLVVCGLLLLRGAQDDLIGRGVVVFTAVVFGLVTLRQALSHAESTRLNRQLAAQAAELRQSQAQMEHRAFHDGLTGLLNRAGFYRALRSALPGGGVSVLLLDLDGFKPINDTYGHAAGDEVLRVVARRLADCTVPQFTAARLGGDEFVLLAPGSLSAEQVQEVAGRVVEAVAQPVMVQGREVRVTGSVGVSYMDQHAADEDSLLRRADAAMYRAKRAGGSRVAQLPDPALTPG